MFKVERNVGRLIEVVLASPLPMEEVLGMVQGVRLQALAIGGPFALISSFRQLRVVPQESLDPMLDMLRRDNPRLIRAGYLLAERRGSLALQVDRIVREAGHPERRWFDQPADLRAWMQASLTPDELASLDRWLAARVKE